MEAYKIIFSSLSMLDYLYHMGIPVEKYEDVEIYYENGEFRIPALTEKILYVEPQKSGEVKITIEAGKLHKLKNLLLNISDQPITATFKNNTIAIHWIEI